MDPIRVHNRNKLRLTAVIRRIDGLSSVAILGAPHTESLSCHIWYIWAAYLALGSSRLFLFTPDPLHQPKSRRGSSWVIAFVPNSCLVLRARVYLAQQRI